MLLAASLSALGACGADQEIFEENTFELARVDVYQAQPFIPSTDTQTGGIPIDTCGLSYDFSYQGVDNWQSPASGQPAAEYYENQEDGPDHIAHIEPLPATTWQFPILRQSQYEPRQVSSDSLTMPGYDDGMPLFERGQAWHGDTRCYELPTGSELLHEAQAYAMYVRLVKTMLWYDIDQTPEFRTAIGLRGTHPGLFDWNGNLPDRFNDTMVLLWRDSDGTPHVREFPQNTDTGAVNFGYQSSSSLRPNRHYSYINGWHRSYNALQMNAWGYAVRDDSNHNGHWDGDRNGWQSGGNPDHDRDGSAHNIHMAARNPPLGSAAVQNWSAGCNVIPGVANWTEFITNAWTVPDDLVDYFLLDVRDIPAAMWTACQNETGTHDCPHEIRSFPFSHSGNTSDSTQFHANVYNCSQANEQGPEVVYVLNVRVSGTLKATIEVNDANHVDPDVHLLWGDDSNACLARGHEVLEYSLSPGRYLLVVDTFVNESGTELTGPYTLNVEFN